MTSADRQKIRRETAAAFVENYKINQNGCVMCGYNDKMYCLDFHHINPETKIDTVANMKSAGANPEKIQAEIDKCVLLCCMCHKMEQMGDITNDEIIKKSGFVTK